jgi:hypothetical protein
MSSNQVEGEIIKQACKWNNHTIVTRDYEGADIIYFLGQEGKYDVDISYLLKGYYTRTYHWHYMLKLRM